MKIKAKLSSVTRVAIRYTRSIDLWNAAHVVIRSCFWATQLVLGFRVLGYLQFIPGTPFAVLAVAVALLWTVVFMLWMASGWAATCAIDAAAAAGLAADRGYRTLLAWWLTRREPPAALEPVVETVTADGITIRPAGGQLTPPAGLVLGVTAAGVPSVGTSVTHWREVPTSGTGRP